jgi:hypothetical protein
MNNRAAPFVTTVAIGGFMAWLALATRAPDAGPGEAMVLAVASEPASWQRSACTLPVRWRVADVDPRFGVTPGEVGRAVLDATGLWEEGAGRRLFAPDPRGGIPVRLVYDQRQARTDERLRAEGLVRRADQDLAAQGGELSRAWEAHHDALTRHRAARDALAEDVSKHNQAVRQWNDAGGLPEASAAGWVASERRLREAQGALVQAARDLEENEAALRAAERRLAERVAERNDEMERLERAFPAVSVEAGAYLDARDETISNAVYREIRVFRFRDPDDLVRVLAHEFGHALGIAHVVEEGAVMRGEQGSGETPVAAVLQLHPADIRALDERCPETAPR